MQVAIVDIQIKEELNCNASSSSRTIMYFNQHLHAERVSAAIQSLSIRESAPPSLFIFRRLLQVVKKAWRKAATITRMQSAPIARASTT